MSSILEFLDCVYGDAEGWVDIVNLDPDTKLPNSELFRHWPEDKAFLAKYCSLRADEDTYLSVALFSEQHRTKDDPKAIANAVWSDGDTCAPEFLKATPSIIVQTSPNRWHYWWVLEEPVPASEAAEVSQRIAYFHREQGMDLGWFASKILRVPGTSNLKYEGSKYEVTAEYTGVLYTLDELREIYPSVKTASVVKELSGDIPEILSTSQLIDVESRVVRGSGFEDLYVTVPPEGADWSDRLFRLQFDLFRAGCSAQEVFTLSKNAACNKFERDHRPDSDLWKTVQNAYRKFAADLEASSEGTALTKGLVPSYTVPEFLSDHEREHLPETFIDKYTAWVATRSDSAPTYQRTWAYMLLSCVFGDRAYLPERYGPQNLNFYAFFLGDSTRTRKTTGKTLFLRVLHGYETNALRGERLEIGNDITKEGISKELGERDGLVSLFVTDEISGALKEWYGKNYQIGTIAYLTELYEGRVPVVLRAGKGAGQTKRAKTVFNMAGIGVREDVAKILNKDDFASGFLARVLWSVADPPPRKPGSDDWGDEIEAAWDDVEIARMVSDLTNRARKFSTTAREPVHITDEAKTRYNYFAEVVRAHSESFDDGSLEAAVGRFLHSVRRAAALLALYDGVTTITLKHLLPVLEQAEFWYADMLRMFNEVSASEFERLLNDVERFIATGNGGARQDSAVRRKFAALKPQEIRDVLESLKAQGRIRSNGSANWQALM